MLSKFFTTTAVAGMAIAGSVTVSSANASTITTGTYGTSTTIACSSNDTACGTAFKAAGNNSAVGSATDSVNWGTFAMQKNTPSNKGSIGNGAQMTTPNGDAVTVTTGDQKSLTTYDDGQGTAPSGSGRTAVSGSAWDGMFANGTTIVFTSDSSNSAGITLTFATPLIGLGIDAQIFNSGAYSETLTAYNSLGAVIGVVTEASTSAGVNNGVTSAEGTAPFVGISTNAQNTTASLNSLGISYVTISANCTSASCNSGGFAIDTSLLYHYPITAQNQTQATPEPGTLGLLGAGLAGLGYIRRRMRRQA